MIWFYYGVVGNDKQGMIMSIEKTTAEAARPRDAQEDRSQLDAAATVPNGQLKVLSLEFEDDNFGADPYNRTGSFCQLEQKDRD